MFGLTKREQRWKAEQQAMESLIGLVVALAEAESRARIAEAAAKKQAALRQHNGDERLPSEARDERT